MNDAFLKSFAMQNLQSIVFRKFGRGIHMFQSSWPLQDRGWSKNRWFERSLSPPLCVVCSSLIKDLSTDCCLPKGYFSLFHSKVASLLVLHQAKGDLSVKLNVAVTLNSEPTLPPKLELQTALSKHENGHRIQFPLCEISSWLSNGSDRSVNVVVASRLWLHPMERLARFASVCSVYALCM